MSFSDPTPRPTSPVTPGAADNEQPEEVNTLHPHHQQPKPSAALATREATRKTWGLGHGRYDRSAQRQVRNCPPGETMKEASTDRLTWQRGC
jgi:hypothetical protein